MAVVHYCIEAADLHAHLWRVKMTIDLPATQQILSLPAWIPGSYMVREFSKHLQRLECKQSQRKLQVDQLDKASWAVACDDQSALEVSYEVYALDNSVRSAWLDSSRGFFNPTSLCLMAQGLTDKPHTLELRKHSSSKHWRVATGLPSIKTDKQGFGLYGAPDYDALADCPIEMGEFWSGEFLACGVKHRLVVAGAMPSFDSARLLKDTQKICETHLQFWHQEGLNSSKNLASKTPFSSYVFLLNAVDDNYGGLEHRNSTALIAARKDLPRVGDTKTSEGYITLLGLISHEYFHTWNVKRLRPVEFTRYDYTQENYTHLLWFFEGFTSYYDDLLLRRSGLIDDVGYFKLLTKTMNQVFQTPGRLVQSVAQASMDAWVKYYRQDENTPNATVSYYTKGALVAACLDLSLRQSTTVTLDHIMRGLWVRCKAGPMQEEDLLAVLLEKTDRSWTKEIKAWVHTTKDLPIKELLVKQQLQVLEEPAQMAQRLGVRTVDSNGAVHIKVVLRGGAAEAAGLCAGDEWLGIEVGNRADGDAWRINKIEDLLPLLADQRKMTAIVSRDKRFLRLALTLPPKTSTLRIHSANRKTNPGQAPWL
jgi:predicted metalloprotease with PDZ domain